MPEILALVLKKIVSIVFMAQSHREASRRLFEVAEQQQGFFTTKQARAAGFAENTHPYHVQVGNWIRQHRGIYRLALFPTSERPDLVLWALWSRNRDEEVEGAYSHQTALSLYELSDLNPAKLHMTVSTDFRRNSEIPGILVLYHADIPEATSRWGKASRSHELCGRFWI
ncbi:MAG TPA: type IV toxin-antitoxin system AbiEi family antitoxin domain-containing protein [Terriglobales bacterium]